MSTPPLRFRGDNGISTALRAKEPDLARMIGAMFGELAFTNRYTLHPRRFAELAREESALFLRFVESGGEQEVRVRGQTLAHLGMGDKSVLGLPALLRRFCRQALAADAPDAREAAHDAVDQYGSILAQGFIQTREEQVLKDQEQLRRALSTALETQSKELLVKNHAINTSINGIILTDLDGKVTSVNASFLSLWGYQSAAQVSGLHISALWAGEDAQRILEVLPRAGGWRGELVARRKDGSTFSVELSASLIRNEEGKAVGIMTSFVDITDRKRLQAQILQAQKMDALGQLAGGITHDFNNLLTAISGYIQLLLINAPRDSRMHEDLMQIKAAVDRGTGLTQQLRFFTRQASGNRQSVSLNDVARETWEILKRTFPPEIAIELALEPDLWSIEADPNQLSQVLVNLCVNARDAMVNVIAAHGGGTLTLETQNVVLGQDRVGRYMTAQPGKYVRAVVRDTGVGMSAELLEHLFIPFVTTKSAKSGTGLGLAVVYGIVASHKAFIDVQSVEGQGSAFELFFPMSDRKETTHVQQALTPPLARGAGTILVVEDETQVREIVSRALASCGYTVLTASDGREGLVRFGAGKGIDLVILDMMMPGMGGRECLAHLRGIDPGVRVLVTTGYTSDTSAQAMIAEGALGIVEKPLDLKNFAETVQKILSTPR